MTRGFLERESLEGNTVVFGMKNISAGHHFAEQVVTKYPEGKTLQVFYNPADYTKSVLEPGLSKKSFVLFAIGMTFVLIASCFATVAWLFT